MENHPTMPIHCGLNLFFTQKKDEKKFKSLYRVYSLGPKQALKLIQSGQFESARIKKQYKMAQKQCNYGQVCGIIIW